MAIYIFIIILAAVFTGLIFFFWKRSQNPEPARFEPVPSRPAQELQTPAAPVNTVEDFSAAVERSQPDLKTPVARENDLVKKLHKEMLQMSGGDEAKIKRLVAFERKNHPEFDEAECYTAAIERWKRDRD